MAIQATDEIDLTNMTDGYTVILSNESHTFTGNQNGVDGIQTTTCIIQAYCDDEAVECTVGAIECPEGLSITSNGATPSPTLTIQATSVLAKGGSVNIPVDINGTSFTKAFSWSISFKGNNGDDGKDGEDAILVSEIQPTNPEIGQLWQTASGEPIKRWDGTNWVIHYISIDNLKVDRLSAISAELGDVTAAKITGSLFDETTKETSSITIDSVKGEIAVSRKWYETNEHSDEESVCENQTSIASGYIYNGYSERFSDDGGTSPYVQKSLQIENGNMIVSEDNDIFTYVYGGSMKCENLLQTVTNTISTSGMSLYDEALDRRTYYQPRSIESTKLSDSGYNYEIRFADRLYFFINQAITIRDYNNRDNKIRINISRSAIAGYNNDDVKLGIMRFRDTTSVSGLAFAHVEFDNRMHITGQIYIDNEKAIYGRLTDGSWTSLIYVGAGNYTMVGYSSYRNSIANTGTRVYGNDVQLMSRTTITGNKAYTNSSDRRLKKDITDIPDEFINLWLELQPKRFKYRNSDDDLWHVGFIAQEVIDLFKKYGLDYKEYGFVTTFTVEEDETLYFALTYEYFDVLTLLVSQRQQKLINDMSERLNKLEKYMGGNTNE